MVVYCFLIDLMTDDCLMHEKWGKRLRIVRKMNRENTIEKLWRDSDKRMTN